MCFNTFLCILYTQCTYCECNTYVSKAAERKTICVTICMHAHYKSPTKINTKFEWKRERQLNIIYGWYLILEKKATFTVNKCCI